MYVRVYAHAYIYILCIYTNAEFSYMDVMESLSSAVDPLKCAVQVSLGQGAIRSARSWKKWSVS